MLGKLLTSAVTGAVLISAILLYYDFNPLHNERWILTAAAIAATGTLTAELSIRKNPHSQLKQLLKRNVKRLPATSPQWQPSLELLEALRQAESRKNGQL